MANNNNDKLVSVGGLTEFRDKSTEEVAVLFEGEQQRTESNYQKILALETVSGSSVSKQLSPNKFYSFGTVTSLTITLATPTANIHNEYLFEFDSGSTATTLSLPASVEGIDATEIEAGMHYEISIKYTTQGGGKYYGLIASW